MRRTQRDEIFLEAYSHRINLLKALNHLKENSSPHQALSVVLDATDKIINLLGENPAKSFYEIFRSLSVASQNLLKWKEAIKNAEANDERFKKAYDFHIGDAIKKLKDRPESKNMLDIATLMSNAKSTDDVDLVLGSLVKFALPLPIHWEEDRYANRIMGPSPREFLREKEPEPIVFLDFKINGKNITTPHIVEPNKLYDLLLEVRINKWPQKYTKLLIRPVSTTYPENYQMPEFEIDKNDKKESYSSKGTMLIKVEQIFESDPIEFVYGAYLLPEEKSIAVVGNNRLKIKSDMEKRLIISGYSEADKVLVDIRSHMVNEKGITASQRSDFLLILKSLANIAGQALQAKDFPGCWDEKTFQDEIERRLRLIPDIGSELIEHPNTAGGILDLYFRKLSIELKVEEKTLVTLDNALSFSQQASQYTTGCDNRLGILCILDCSEKKVAPGSIANDIGLRAISVPGIIGKGFPLILGVVIIKGNLPTPSSFSK